MTVNPDAGYHDYVDSTTKQVTEFLDNAMDEAEQQMYSGDQWDLHNSIAEWLNIRSDELLAGVAKIEMN